MRRIFFKVVLLTAVILTAVVVVLIPLIPKAIILDRLLMERGIFILAGDVKEGVFSVALKDAVIFSKGKRIMRFDTLEAGLSLKGLELEGTCGKGSIMALAGVGGELELEAKNFGCVEGLKMVNGSLKVSSDVRGKVLLEGIDTGVVTVDRIELRFRGKEFDGKVVYGKFEFEGKGRIKLDRKDILNTSINARFTGALGRVLIGGTLRNPRIQTP